jgi:hypothetical protein
MKTVLLVMALILFAGCAEDGSLLEEDGGADGGDSDSDTDSEEEYDTDCADGCTDPPPDTCDVDSNLVQYSGASSCVEDVCVYEFEVVACGFTCIVESGDDHCQDTACEGVVCDDPPDDECVNSETLKDYYDIGECTEVGGEGYEPGDCGYGAVNDGWFVCPEGTECILVSGADDYCG